MKRVGSIKQALRPSLKSNSANNDAVNNNESNKMNSSNDRRQSTSNLSAGLSILGNFGAPQSNDGQSKPDFHLPKSISSFLKAGKGTLTRNKKDKTNQVSFCNADEESNKIVGDKDKTFAG